MSKQECGAGQRGTLTTGVSAPQGSCSSTQTLPSGFMETLHVAAARVTPATEEPGRPGAEGSDLAPH